VSDASEERKKRDTT
jgi:hypothetical protein